MSATREPVHTTEWTPTEAHSRFLAHRGRNAEEHGKGTRTRHIAPVGRSADWVLPDGTMIAGELDTASMTDHQLELMATTALAQAFPGEKHTIGYRYDSKAEVVSVGTGADLAKLSGTIYANSMILDAIDTETLRTCSEALREAPETVRPCGTADMIGALSEDRGRYGKPAKVARQNVRRKTGDRRRKSDPQSATTVEAHKSGPIAVDSTGTAERTQALVTRLVTLNGNRVAIGHAWQDRPESKTSREQRVKAENAASKRTLEHTSATPVRETVLAAMRSLTPDNAVIVHTSAGTVRLSHAASGFVSIASTIEGTPARKRTRSLDNAETHLTSILD